MHDYFGDTVDPDWDDGGSFWDFGSFLLLTEGSEVLCRDLDLLDEGHVLGTLV